MACFGDSVLCFLLARWYSQAQKHLSKQSLFSNVGQQKFSAKEANLFPLPSKNLSVQCISKKQSA